MDITACTVAWFQVVWNCHGSHAQLLATYPQWDRKYCLLGK